MLEKRGKMYLRSRLCHSWRTVKYLAAHLFDAEEPHCHDSKGWSEDHGEGEGPGGFQYSGQGKQDFERPIKRGREIAFESLISQRGKCGSRLTGWKGRHIKGRYKFLIVVGIFANDIGIGCRWSSEGN